MNKFIKNKAFVIGFFGGVVLFLCLNYYTVMRAFDDMCFDYMRVFGFPFTFVETGGFVTHTDIFWFSLIVDILITLIFSVVTGLIFKVAWSKISSRRVKLK